LGKASREAGHLVLFARGGFVFKKGGGVVFILRLVFVRSKPAGARERAKPMGGAARRPDKSEMGVCL
jgi:hypothetical protein